MNFLLQCILLALAATLVMSHADLSQNTMRKRILKPNDKRYAALHQYYTIGCLKVCNTFRYSIGDTLQAVAIINYDTL